MLRAHYTDEFCSQLGSILPKLLKQEVPKYKQKVLLQKNVRHGSLRSRG